MIDIVAKDKFYQEMSQRKEDEIILNTEIIPKNYLTDVCLIATDKDNCYFGIMVSLYNVRSVFITGIIHKMWLNESYFESVLNQHILDYLELEIDDCLSGKGKILLNIMATIPRRDDIIKLFERTGYDVFKNVDSAFVGKNFSSQRHLYRNNTYNWS